MTSEAGTSPKPLPPAAPTRTATGVLVSLVIGAAVAVTLGVYGRVHSPTGIAVNVAGFSSPLTVKVWLALAPPCSGWCSWCRHR